MRIIPAAAAYLRAWGRVGHAISMLLVGAGALHWGPTQLWRDEAEQAFQANIVQSLAAGNPMAAVPRPAGSPPENTLPDAGGFDRRLDVLLGHAASAGLRVGDVTFAAPGAAPRGTTQSRVDLSAQGDYAAVRGFLQAALVADPALSLDQLRLSRPQVDVTDLQAHMTWTFHARMLGSAKP